MSEHEYYTIEYLIDSNILDSLTFNIKDKSKTEKHIIQILKNNNINIYYIDNDIVENGEDPRALQCLYKLIGAEKKGDNIYITELCPVSDDAIEICNATCFFEEPKIYKDANGIFKPISISDAKVNKLELENALNLSMSKLSGTLTNRIISQPVSSANFVIQGFASEEKNDNYQRNPKQLARENYMKEHFNHLLGTKLTINKKKFWEETLYKENPDLFAISSHSTYATFFRIARKYGININFT